MTRFFVFVFSVFFAFALCSTAVTAQSFNFNDDEEPQEGPKLLNPYDEKYRPLAFTKKSAGDAGDAIPEGPYSVSFRREGEAQSEVITILLTLPASVSGCVSIQGGEVKMNKIAGRLELDISNREVNLGGGAHGERHYAHYQCGMKSQGSALEIPLTRSMFTQENIRRIKLRSAGKDIKDVLVSVHDHYIGFLPVDPGREKDDLSIRELSEELRYWAYPANTLVLNAKDTNDQKVAKDVRALARARGLTPLEEILPGFKPTDRNRHNIYAVDVAKQYVNKLATAEDSLTLGFIKTTEQYFSANGPYDKVIKNPVSARLPASDE